LLPGMRRDATAELAEPRRTQLHHCMRPVFQALCQEALQSCQFTKLQYSYFDRHLLRRCRDRISLVGAGVHIPQHCEALRIAQHLPYQLQPFA
jgi:hypothetical protein